jgi:hypothetical protein
MDLQYLKNVGMYVISAIVSLLVIAYIVYHAVGSFNTTIETMVSEVITERDTINLEAYIFRDETIVYSPVDGTVNYLFNDGDKIAINSLLANIYPGGSVNADRTERIEIEKKLNVLEHSNLTSNIATMDTTAIDNNINELMNIIRYRIEIGDIEYALYRKDELLILLNQRSIITKTESNYDDKIQVLRDQKASLTISDAASEASYVHAEKAGYFYSGIDGYENILSSKNISRMTVDEFQTLISSDPEIFIAGGKGYSIGKIVTNYRWYISCEISNDKLRNFVEGRTYDVVFPYNNDTVINMTLERIVQDPTDNTVVVVFSTGTIPENFNFYRKQNIEIVKTSYTGYKVPIASVHITDDGRQGVYILDGSIVKFKEIVPLIESNGFFIVEEQDKLNDEDYRTKLALFDLIITKGTKLYEGKSVEF